MDEGLGPRFGAFGEQIVVAKPSPPHSKTTMFFFYILQSLKDKDLYFGFTADLRQRMAEHNKGRVPSTKNRRPLRLVYYEAYLSEKDARSRERQIKLRAQALTSLKRRIKDSISM